MSVWIGYFEQYNRRSEMSFDTFNINERLVNARGRDRCGEFTYEGTIVNRVFQGIKRYSGWNIYYHGNYDSDKSEIFGFWGFSAGEDSGNFKIQKVRNTQVDDFRAYHGIQ